MAGKGEYEICDIPKCGAESATRPSPASLAAPPKALFYNLQSLQATFFYLCLQVLLKSLGPEQNKKKISQLWPHFLQSLHFFFSTCLADPSCQSWTFVSVLCLCIQLVPHTILLDKYWNTFLPSFCFLAIFPVFGAGYSVVSVIFYDSYICEMVFLTVPSCLERGIRNFRIILFSKKMDALEFGENSTLKKTLHFPS